MGRPAGEKRGFAVSMRPVSSLPSKVRQIEHCWIPMSDGVRLAARIWMPEDAESHPVPAILEYIPYRKRDAISERDETIHPYFAGHGYAAVRIDIRGSGDSEGLLLGEYLEQDHDDALEALAWIAGQPWCDGGIGMMGLSWGGFESLQVAARRPPELKAVISVGSVDDRYADDMHFKGGCLLNDNMYWHSLFFSLLSRPPDPMIVGERWREMWLDRLENLIDPIGEWLPHQRRDAFWKHGSVCEDYGAIACPVYLVGGWADSYINSIPSLLDGLKVPRKGLIGPWGHQYPQDKAPPGPWFGFLQEALRWWDHWLKGVDTGIMAEPMYRVWMAEETPPDPGLAETLGRWVAEAAWPPPDDRLRRWHLLPGRLAGAAGEDVPLTLSSPLDIGTASGCLCPYGLGSIGHELASDQREDDGKSLCFDTEPLTERVEFVGAPVAILDLSVDRPVAQISARLCDVAPDGASTRVTFGLLNLTHRDGDEEPEPMEPGRRYRIRLRLDHMAYSFVPGHRIRLAVATSYWPIVWPSPTKAVLTLHTGESVLDLPVRRPRPEDATLRHLEEPESAEPEPRTWLVEAGRQRSVHHDVVTGITTLEAHKHRGWFRIESHGLEMSSDGSERYRTHRNDPTRASGETRQHVLIGRGDWQLRIETATRMWCDAERFHTRSDIDAYDGDTRVFCRTWGRSVARDLV